jgi:hypothetical protein
MSFFDAILLVGGTYYVIDGLAGFIQTRRWPFLSELFGAWLVAMTPLVAAQPMLRAILIAVGAFSLLPIAFSLITVFRSDAGRQSLREFIAVRRQPRTLIEQFTFRYKPYSELPPIPPPRQRPSRRERRAGR